VTLNRDFKVTM